MQELWHWTYFYEILNTQLHWLFMEQYLSADKSLMDVSGLRSREAVKWSSFEDEISSWELQVENWWYDA